MIRRSGEYAFVSSLLTCTRGIPRINVAATNPHRSPTTPPPIGCTVITRTLCKQLLTKSNH